MVICMFLCLVDSPLHKFKKVVRKVMNKPNLDAMRENMEEEARKKRKGDVETVGILISASKCF